MARNKYYKKPDRRGKKRDTKRSADSEIVENVEVAPVDKRPVSIPGVLTVKEFSEISALPATEIIMHLMKNGILATLNDSIDFETAAIVGDDLGLAIQLKEGAEEESAKAEEIQLVRSKDLVPRPPVVTIMGHVDHGKTTLLDRIREEHVADSESGGITQHISAYQVTLDKVKNKDIKNRTITFIDTPGHAAFSALRSHGAAITDIVVLIVAADDGVMPQTKEVIEQINKNNVPTIVAINKTDLPDSDIMKTKQQLSDAGLLPEEWGGKTVVIEISAKTGKGVDELLEMILLQADMIEPKANPKEKAVGVVIESHMQKGAGALAIVLITNGTLEKGDHIQIGSTYGKARIMEDFALKPITKAGPSTPVRIAGLKSLPSFGDHLLAYGSEKDARNAASKVQKGETLTHISTAKRLNEDEDGEDISIIEYNLIIKSDVKGSLEAIKKMIGDVSHPDIKITLVSEGIGSVNESDISLARSTKSEVVSFRVAEMQSARKIAEKEKVTVKSFDIIYELIDYIKARMSEILPELTIEDELASGDVLAIFRDDKKGVVVGCRINSGAISKGNEVKIFQNQNEKWRGKIESLRREKSEVNEVATGQEFGMGLPAHSNVSVGDTYIVFKSRQEKRTVE